MPSRTVIDSLIVELGLDPKKFTEGQKAALESFKRSQDSAIQFGQTIESQGKKIDDVFTSLKREALGFVTLFLGGRSIKNFVSDVTALDAATGRVALTLNMSAREVSAWQGASEQMGGTAQGITAAMQGLSGAMNTFMLTGQGPFLGVMNHLGLSMFDANKRLKTAGEMFLEISDAIHKLNESDPARAAATLAMIPGANQDSINLMLRGRAAIEGLLRASRDAGGTTFESAEAAAEYQKQLALLDRSATSFGRTLLTLVAPGLTAVMDALTKLLNSWRTPSGSPEDKLQNVRIRKGMNRLLGDPKDFVNWFNRLVGQDTPENRKEVEEFFGPGTAEDRLNREAAEATAEKAKRDLVQNTPGQRATSKAEQIAYIRQAAIARGIDPNIALQVAASEGLHSTLPGQQSTIVRADGTREDSWGPFQLFMGGGLGNKFQQKTGLNPRDPTTWKAQVDFALDEAKKGGWGPWHGWRGTPRAGLDGPVMGARGAAAAGSPGLGRQSAVDDHSTHVQIGSVQVNAPNARNADEIANEIPGSLKRANWAASANYGLSG